MMDLKMEVYSPFLELLGLLEIQNSVMWESKAFSAGSFTLNSLITEETKTLLVPENIIWIAGDDAGIIEYVQQETGEDGPYITVKGCNLTGALGRYILWGPYNLTGPVPEIMRRLVDNCCIHPTLGDFPETRIIPNLVLSDEIAASGPSIRSQKTGGNLLDTLEELGTAYGVPFGVRFNPAVPCMEFWARYGVNRSIRQDSVEPVFYSTELDDVLSSEYSYNAQNWRNVALVAGEGEGKDRVMVTVNGDTEPSPTPPTPPTPSYTISLSVDPEGGGVASGGGTVSEGQSVTVTAAPSSGYVFVEWQENGQTISTEAVYTFIVRKNQELVAVFAVMTPMEYHYSGQPVAVTLNPGRYKLEVWGAQGGYRSNEAYAGKGGYSTGILTLTERTNLFVRVGGSGNTGGKDGGFNGGGKRSSYPGGGGGSDIRIGTDDVNHRVIVAGGGGSDGGATKPGRYGGGLTGGDVGASGSANGYGTAGYGGTQTGNSGGAGWIAQEPATSTTADSDAKSGFGFGGNGINKSSGFGGAGGGGWYGGTGRVPDSSGDDDGGGGGGSGFVLDGANKPEGFGLTEAYYLKDAETIDGSKTFVSPDGTDETGHTGDGYARITPLPPPKMYTITIIAGENGTASGGGVYEEGTRVTVTAVPNDGYRLNGWMENGESVSTNKKYTFTANKSRTLTAEFVEGVDSRLPDGYTEVEYIYMTKANRSAYIPTEYLITKQDIISITCQRRLNTDDGKFFGYRLSSDQRAEVHLQTYDSDTYGKKGTPVFMMMWNKYTLFDTVVGNNKATYKIDYPNQRVAVFMGEQTETKAASFSPTAASTLNFMNSIYQGNCFTGYIYGCTITDSSDTVKADFIPCQKESGEIGLYEIVAQKFYTVNTDSEYLAAGPAVQ